MKNSSRLAVALVVVLGHPLANAAPAPGGLKSEAVPNELGLHLNEYALSWKADGQQAFQVLVASDERKLGADTGDLWDSGWRESAEQSGVLCRGKAITDGATVWWKVRVRSADGEPGPWSEPARIEVPGSAAAVKKVRRPGGLRGGKPEFVAGRNGKALLLGAKRPVVWADDYSELRPAEGTTIAAWIKPGKTGDDWQCIFRKEDGGDRRLFTIGRTGEIWGLWGGFGIGGRFVELGAPYDPKKLGDGKWHHVAVSFDGRHLRLFVDGAKIGEKEQPGKLGRGGSAPAFIGSYGGGMEHFEGGIDDLRVYGTALDGKAMAALAGGETEVSPEALVGHWTFDGTIDNEATYAVRPARNRIVLLGGTLVSRMDKYGYLESAISSRWPHHDITFRNLGWPADDAFGTARSEFGSAQSTGSWVPPKGQPGYGFKKLKKQLADAQPSTLIVGYGSQAAFADTEEKMKVLEAGYRALIGELERSGAKLILLTPVEQYKHGRVVVNPAERNRRLKHAGAFIQAFAKVRGHAAVDLFETVGFEEAPENAPANPHFQNGVHLTENGYRKLASYLAGKLGVRGGQAVLQTPAEGKPTRIGGGLLRGVESIKRGMRFELTLDRLPSSLDAPPPKEKEPIRVRIDGVMGAFDPESGTVRSGADYEQAGELRRAIIEKNKFHRYRLNPINKTYIFLFRRHEMGHLAYEMEDFNELIESREKLIANLRVPRPHRYEVEKAEPWKAPREYTDTDDVPPNVPAPDVAAERKALKVAEGFQVNLFASNPMIFNPINLNWDRRGRAWVSTSSTYPHIKPGRFPNDRIVILEDTNRDGVADKSTVFAEGLTIPHSVMPVKGGAYVCSTTEVLFLADSDGDDRADSKLVMFSGFGNADVHHMIHGLRWSPWGDLFFMQSVYTNSFVETAHGPRRLNGSGFWRFRPEIERLDIYSRGLVNPWGLAFDFWGRSFGTDGAGFYGPNDVFQGSAFNSAVGVPRILSGLIRGQPKNTGAEFMSGRHIPSHWQGSLLANDFRGNRTVRYKLEESGSGFKAIEAETVLHSSYRAFRPGDVKMGPDGAVYVVDWYNSIIDHGEVDFYHPQRDKSHGRIWRITAADRELVKHPEIAGATPSELLDHLKAPEQYTRTQANRELVRREVPAAAIEAWLGKLDPKDSNYNHHRLEALWLYMARNEKPAESLTQLLSVSDPRIRAAAAEMAGRTAKALENLAVAVEDGHPRVRLEAVCALRGIGSLSAVNLALRALDYEVDQNLDFALEMTVRDTRNQWLPAMQAGKKVFDGKANRLSYALKKVNDPRAIEALVTIVKSCELKSSDLENAVATVSALGKPEELAGMVALAEKTPGLLEAVVRGAEFNEAVPKVGGTMVSFLSSKDASVRTAAARLCGIWKLSGTKEWLAKCVAGAGGTEERLAMTTALAKLGAADSLQGLWAAEKPAAVRAAAIAAHAAVNPESSARVAAQVLRDLAEPADDVMVFEAFLARGEGPALLAKALAGSKLRESVALAGSRTASASGRQVPELLAALNEAGGLKPLAPSLAPSERQSLIADAESKGSAERGRQVYERTAMACTTCHLVNGKGGKLGPDLSTVGSYMTPESMLESLLNPSTDIKQGYETVIVTKKDQTLVSGLLQRKTDTAALVRDPSGQVVSIPSGEIAKVDTSPVSLMPPGLTSTLRRDELVDLMACLTSLGK